jgi:chloramphenicol O-acetyltransferase
MNKQKISNRKLSFLIAFFYVLTGTFYSYWEFKSLITDGILYYLFFPVAFFPFLILFTEREPGFMILMCQLITLFFVWSLVWGVLRVFRKDNNAADNL